MDVGGPCLKTDVMTKDDVAAGSLPLETLVPKG